MGAAFSCPLTKGVVVVAVMPVIVAALAGATTPKAMAAAARRPIAKILKDLAVMRLAYWKKYPD
jgi:hypothetical protein